VFSPQCLRESQHEKCTRRGSGGEHNSCHCQCPVPTQPSLSHAELWCIVFRTAKHRRVSTDLSARGATACATLASPLAEPFQLQLSGLEASSTASGGALGCLPARLLIPRPPPGRDHSSSAAVLVRVVFFLSSLLACRPAAATDRTGSQPATASINQHHPSWSTLTAALAHSCTSNHNLQATGHGTWPSPIAPSPILPTRSRAPRTVDDERPSNRGREPAKEGWETEDTRAQHKAQGTRHKGTTQIEASWGGRLLCGVGPDIV
jgi:hypothetical protein